MATKRCAYFACMTPLFESDDARRKYCSDECAARAKNRSTKQKEANERLMAKYLSDPVKAARARDISARAGYKKKATTGKLPDWMKT